MPVVKRVLTSPVPRTRRARASEAVNSDSRQRLLDSACELLAEQGLGGFKVIEVARRAQANVALISYHYGSRDGLLDEVIRLGAARVGVDRLARLTELLKLSASAAPTVGEIMACWIEPLIDAIEKPEERGAVLALIHVMFAGDVDEARKTAVLDDLMVVSRQFLDVLETCMPTASRAQLTWRLLCAIGSCYLILSRASPIGWHQLSKKGRASAEPQWREALAELRGFVEAGMSGPLPVPERAAKRAAPRRKASVID